MNTGVKDEELSWLWSLFEQGNLKAVRNMCPPDFDWSSLHPENHITVLQCLISSVVPVDKEQLGATIELAKWMIQQGADPTLKAPETCDHETAFWVEGEEDDESKTIEVHYGDSSAITAVLQLINAFRGSRKLEKTWAREIVALEKLQAAFTAASFPHMRRLKHSVDAQVVGLWELMCKDTASHDMSFKAQDGTVTAHSMILTKSSCVLAAILSSGMSECKNRVIEVRDASKDDVDLFLMLLYTGSTDSDCSHDSALSALDLAHRWQVNHVVTMLEHVLGTMVSDATFVSIAEAAKLKGLPHLTTACRNFGANSASVKAQAKARALPKPVMELLGLILEDTSTATKKRRTW